VEAYIQVHTTTDTKEGARKMAETLIEKRKAACVQIVGPILSTYWWKGKVETAEEWLCLIKSKAAVYDELEKIIKETHSYETPEIIAMPIFAGSVDYLEWLNSEVQIGE